MPTFWFPNDGTGEGERLGSIVPVPDTPAVWGLLLALSVTVKVALRVPVAVGVNVTLIEHVALAARLVGLIGLSFIWPLSLAVKPVMLMLSMVLVLPWTLTAGAALVA